jgi:hypothetical protein
LKKQKLNNVTYLIFTEKGVYQHIAINKMFKQRRDKGLSLPCSALCGHNLKRPHFTCIHCRIRRVWLGQIPDTFEVKPLLILVMKNRKFAKIKNYIIKNLVRIIEFLAN